MQRPGGRASQGGPEPSGRGCLRGLPPIIEPQSMGAAPFLDTAIAAFDRALRAVCAPARACRPPPETNPPQQPLSDSDRRASAALMRVNHAGELAAQALYRGQAIIARSGSTRAMLLGAARS